MNNRSWLQRLFDASVTALMAAVMLVVAVRLIRSVLPWLAGGAGLLLLAALVIAFLRYRNQRW